MKIAVFMFLSFGLARDLGAATFDQDQLDELLFEAIKESNAGRVRELLTQGVNANAIDTNNNNKTPLHIAAERGNVTIIQDLLQYKADINSQDNKGKTPLHIALDNNNENAIKVLVFWKADVNSRDNQGNSPLMIAIEAKARLRQGDRADKTADQILKFLSKKKDIQLDIYDCNGDSALTLAIKNRFYGLAHELLSKGAPVNPPTSENPIKSTYKIPLIVAIEQYVAPTTLQEQQKLNSLDKTEQRKSLNLIKKLLKKGADTRAEKRESFSPQADHALQLDELMIGDQVVSIRTPITTAIFYGNIPAVLAILEHREQHGEKVLGEDELFSALSTSISISDHDFLDVFTAYALQTKAISLASPENRNKLLEQARKHPDAKEETRSGVKYKRKDLPHSIHGLIGALELKKETQETISQASSLPKRKEETSKAKHRDAEKAQREREKREREDQAVWERDLLEQKKREEGYQRDDERRCVWDIISTLQREVNALVEIINSAATGTKPPLKQSLPPSQPPPLPMLEPKPKQSIGRPKKTITTEKEKPASIQHNELLKSVRQGVSLRKVNPEPPGPTKDENQAAGSELMKDLRKRMENRRESMREDEDRSEDEENAWSE